MAEVTINPSPIDRFPKVTPPKHSGVSARLTSLDGGGTFGFRIPPSEQDRSTEADWQRAGVAQASLQFVEYAGTSKTRVIKFTLDAYDRPGGESNSLEAEIRLLESFAERAPGKKRAHKCRYSQGEQAFLCVVKRVSILQRRVGKTGGALQAADCSIELEVLPG
ncbi:MAG: hypothetical protein HY231_23845 [Acidobacteria bacterium]|nr:hypothetical protein [Acidobacteriota bacterium]